MTDLTILVMPMMHPRYAGTVLICRSGRSPESVVFPQAQRPKTLGLLSRSEVVNELKSELMLRMAEGVGFQPTTRQGRAAPLAGECLERARLSFQVVEEVGFEPTHGLLQRQVPYQLGYSSVVRLREGAISRVGAYVVCGPCHPVVRPLLQGTRSSGWRPFRLSCPVRVPVTRRGSKLIPIP